MSFFMSSLRESSRISAGSPSRGFIYFCEERLGYFSGPRAWYFFGPFLLGALIVESFAPPISGVASWRSWLPLLAYILIFPPVWRAILIRAGGSGRRSR
jgi:hypothetical protein